MSSKVYVGGLPWTCNADDLKIVCSKFGNVEDGMYLETVCVVMTHGKLLSSESPMKSE